jgi:RNA polymerase sigma-70 factor (ECF subfamily)
VATPTTLDAGTLDLRATPHPRTGNLPSGGPRPEDLQLAETWQRGVEGDSHAFDRVVRLLSPAVLGYLRQLGAPSAEVRDLGQETFLRAYRSRRQFRNGSPRAWLCRLARNAYFDWLRQPVRRELPTDRLPESPAADGGPHQAAEIRQRLDWVRRQAEQLLTPSERRVMLLRLQGALNDEIAERTGISAAAVRVHASNGLRRLRQASARLHP